MHLQYAKSLYVVIHSLSGYLLYNKLLPNFLHFRYVVFHRVVSTTSTPIGVEGVGRVAMEWWDFDSKINYTVK